MGTSADTTALACAFNHVPICRRRGGGVGVAAGNDGGGGGGSGAGGGGGSGGGFGVGASVGTRPHRLGVPVADEVDGEQHELEREGQREGATCGGPQRRRLHPTR